MRPKAAAGSSSSSSTSWWMGVLCLLQLLLVTEMASGQYTYPATDYEHSVRRDALMEGEKLTQGKVQLSQDERTVDEYLRYLKWVEFEETKESGFPPMRPTEEMLDHIFNSDVYKALKPLPKGGNMHSHEDHQLSRRTLLELVWDSEDFEHLFMQSEESPDHPWMLDFFITPPNDVPWLNVKNSSYTMDDILEHQTFIGIMDEHAKRYPTDSGERWRQMDPLWTRGSTQLIANVAIKEKYLEEMLLYGLEEGVQYLEARKALAGDGRLYELNPSPDYEETHGKHFLDDDGEMDIQLAMNLTARMKQEHSEFIGFKRISYSHRMSDFDSIAEMMQRVHRYNQKYPEHILGYDMVGEEDAGNSHLYYLDNFMDLYDGETEASIMPLYLHTAETNWPADLMSSRTPEDLVSTHQNAYESLLLNSRRIGHGLGLIKRPVLLRLLRERQIAIEICPVSNQLLGYMADLRNHPAIHYFRTGHPVVLGSDDAGTFGVDSFTVDWYQAFMGWGLDLADLKQLAINSLEYSGMEDEDKSEAIDKWAAHWDTYIGDMVDEACEHTYTTEPTVIRILPREGAIEGTTNVHVFGREFQSGICREVKCKFGENESPASYLSTNHIACEAPDISSILFTRGQRDAASHLNQDDEVEVKVYVSLDGANFFDTNQTFTYRHDPIVPEIPTEPDNPSGSERAVLLHVSLVIITVLLTLHCQFIYM